MAYKSKYEEQLEKALGAITGREQFKYDFNADPMYQMYKDQYTKLGNEAAANAAANVSALTGGYGNSYAATAAAQANQQYLTKLNEQVPTLYQNALTKYQMEGDRLNNQYGLLSDADSRDYEKYRADVADEQWQKNYDQALRQFEESVRQYNQNYAYNQARDAAADAQWQAQFNENNRRYNQEWQAQQAAQAAAQALAQQQAAAKAAQAVKTSGSGNSGSNNTNKTGSTNNSAAYNKALTEAVNIYKNSRGSAGDKALDQAIANAVNKGIIPATSEAVVEMKKAVLAKAR